jgi:hypothetical protein
MYKKLIMAAFRTMPGEFPFDKITAATPVKRAGISPTHSTIIIRAFTLCRMRGNAARPIKHERSKLLCRR